MFRKTYSFFQEELLSPVFLLFPRRTHAIKTLIHIWPRECVLMISPLTVRTNTVHVSSAGNHQRFMEIFQEHRFPSSCKGKSGENGLGLLKKDPLAKFSPPGPIPRGGMKEGRGRDERAFKLTVTY